MDFKIDKVMLKSWIVLEPCNFTLSVGFGKFYANISLFKYKWGTEEILQIGHFLSIRYGYVNVDVLSLSTKVKVNYIIITISDLILSEMYILLNTIPLLLRSCVTLVKIIMYVLIYLFMFLCHDRQIPC